MSTYKTNDENNSTDTEAQLVEIVASQEEIYLEETEEEVREVLTSDDPSSPLNKARHDTCTGESVDEQLTDAANELITGDSDDPPLAEEDV